MNINACFCAFVAHLLLIMMLVKQLAELIFLFLFLDYDSPDFVPSIFSHSTGDSTGKRARYVSCILDVQHMAI